MNFKRIMLILFVRLRSLR